jgi:hypothetical protein
MLPLFIQVLELLTYLPGPIGFHGHGAPVYTSCDTPVHFTHVPTT